ncbi:hypothetical protein KXV65_001867 [Aspergillus fumigatus]|nr:hypothetical protein KXV65_001867 [Aspergillus fumigatus]
MEDARRKYLHNKIFKAIVPHFVDSKYDHDALLPPPLPPGGLLLKKPFDWDDADISKYNSLLQRFVNVLEEEEQKRAGGLPMPSMATLMHESMKDGKFWFHELIYSCFESPDSRAWTAIRQLLPSTDELATVPSPEVDLFA